MPEKFTREDNNQFEPVANGPVLVLLVILLIGILGGMYYWFNVLENQATTPVAIPVRPTAEQNNEPESTTAEAQTEALNTMSSSDELNAIEADLESTNVDTLDAELQAIETELEASTNEEPAP